MAVKKAKFVLVEELGIVFFPRYTHFSFIMIFFFLVGLLGTMTLQLTAGLWVSKVPVAILSLVLHPFVLIRLLTKGGRGLTQ